MSLYYRFYLSNIYCHYELLHQGTKLTAVVPCQIGANWVHGDIERSYAYIQIYAEEDTKSVSYTILGLDGMVSFLVLFNEVSRVSSPIYHHVSKLMRS